MIQSSYTELTLEVNESLGKFVPFDVSVCEDCTPVILFCFMLCGAHSKCVFLLFFFLNDVLIELVVGKAMRKILMTDSLAFNLSNWVEKVLLTRLGNLY